jgi:2-keto-myo-inositol isomerase
LGLNSATTGSIDLLADVGVAHDAGFDALELRTEKLDAYLEHGGTLGELGTAFTRAGVEPLSVGAPNRWAPRASRRGIGTWRQWDRRCAQAAALGCPVVVAAPAPLERPSDAGSKERAATEMLAQMARIASDHTVHVGVELRGALGDSVSTLTAARELLRRVDDPAVGLVVDAFDFYAGRSTWAMLEELDPRLVFLVRLEDAEPRPLDELTDAHRVLPGDGVLPLRELVRRLEGIGYGGVYSIELHRPEYWSWEPLRLARVARDSIEALCAELDEEEGRLDYA